MKHHIKFYGTPDHTPMWWSVHYEGPDNGWAVVESYDEGKTWICNAFMDSEQNAWDFIAAWFCGFYE